MYSYVLGVKLLFGHVHLRGARECFLIDRREFERYREPGLAFLKYSGPVWVACTNPAWTALHLISVSQFHGRPLQYTYVCTYRGLGYETNSGRNKTKGEWEN